MAYSRSRCWDHDNDGWCPLCKGDPDRCPRTADGEVRLATEPIIEAPKEDEDA